MNRKKEFLKAAGVKTEKEFYAKYPNPESFFKDFPKYQYGGQLPQSNEEVIKVVGAFAELTGASSEEIMLQLQQMSEQEREQAIGEMLSALEQQQMNIEAAQAQEQPQPIQQNIQPTVQPLAQDGAIIPPQQPQGGSEIEQIVMMFAEITGANPQEIMQQLQQMRPEEQEQALQQMVQVIQEQQSQEQPQPQPIQQEQGVAQAQNGMVIPSISNPINKVSVENNAIKPISPSFSELGGKPHSKGGTDVTFQSTTVEAQKGEPLSSDNQGNVVAWGKMTNPLTGRMFESDAKILAKDENKVDKMRQKAIKNVGEDYTDKVGAFTFGTGKVLMDASNIQQKKLDVLKNDFADTQQFILDIASLTGDKPEKLATKIAKNGAKLLAKKAQSSLTIPTFEELYPQLMNQDRATTQPITTTDTPQPQANSFGSGALNAINTVGSTIVDGINAIGGIKRDIAVAAPQILNRLIPDIHNKREETINRTYNQYAYGTGSQMMYRNGGTIPDLTQFNQWEDDLRKYIIDNTGMFYMDGLQPRANLSGQRRVGSSYGEAYNEPLANINRIRTLQGQPTFDVSTPEGTRDYQSWYNQQFNSRTGRNYYTGTTDPEGVDGKYGNKTSSHPLFTGLFAGKRDGTLTAEQIANMSDEEFRQYYDGTKAEFFEANKDRPGIGATWQYNFYNSDINRIEPIAGDRGLAVNNPIPKAEPLTPEQRQEALAQVERVTPTDGTERIPYWADQNRLRLAHILPEVAAMFDQPSYIPRQQYTPELATPTRVSFQDRVNQNMGVFNQQAQMMRDNPAALATLAAQTQQANNAVLAEEFRTNQAIANQVANQNLGTLNEAQIRNIGLADQQFVRQEQARENTDIIKRMALKSLSEKFLSNQAENVAIRIAENLSNYRLDENLRATNYNPTPNFRWKNGKKWEDLTPNEKEEALPEAIEFTNKQQDSDKEIKRIGGKFGRRFS